MSPNNGKNIIDLNAVRAHKKDDREIQFTPQTSSRSSNQPVNSATPRRPTPRRRTNASNQKRNVRNSYSHRSQKYQSSLKKNYIKISKLVAAGALAASLALGGFAGYQISNHNTGSVEYSLDEYNPTDLFNATNDLIKEVAEDKLFEDEPDVEETLSDYYLESYNEESITHFTGDVTLKLNYINRNPRDPYKRSYIEKSVTLPRDFGKNVYLPYKDLRETSQAATDNDKAKTSYWLKINTDINNLTNRLETYINESKDKEYTKAAQDILDNSKIIDDDEGR